MFRPSRATVLLLALTAAAGGACLTGPGSGAPNAHLTSKPAPKAAADALGAGFVDASGPMFEAPELTLEFVPTLPPDTTTAIFGDLDGDGLPEVIASTVRIMTPELQRSLAYRYDQTAKALVPDPRTQLEPGLSYLAVVDLDDDGHPDLLTGLGPREVAWGRGAGAFEPSGPLDPANRTTYDMSVASYHLDDVDNDGLVDVLPASTPRVYLNEGGRRFRLREDLFQADVDTVTYTVLHYRHENGAQVYVDIGAHFSDPRGRVLLASTAPGDDGLPRYVTGGYAPGPAWLGSPPNDLTHVSPMGGAIGDLDGDGRLDLAVTTSPRTAFWLGRDGWPYEDVSESLAPFVALSRDRERPMLPWSVAFLDVDRDNRPDILVTRGDEIGPPWFRAETRTGEHRNTLHLVGDDLALLDASDPAGFTRATDSVSLAIDDLEGDGDPDLLMGRFLESPMLYRNEVEIGRRSLGLRLRGTTSNHLGVGARVRIEANGRNWLQLAGGVSSTVAWNEPLVFTGLGADDVASRVSIEWPSGTKQLLRDVPGGRTVRVEEPRVLAVSPRDRHRPAGGEPATIVVTPRDDEGALREAGAVLLRVAAGSPVAIGAPVREGQAWRFTIPAPAMAGSTVLEVSIDGVPVRVRPRLWWD